MLIQFFGGFHGRLSRFWLQIRNNLSPKLPQQEPQTKSTEFHQILKFFSTLRHFDLVTKPYLHNRCLTSSMLPKFAYTLHRNPAWTTKTNSPLSLPPVHSFTPAGHVQKRPYANWAVKHPWEIPSVYYTWLHRSRRTRPGEGGGGGGGG